MSTKAIIEETNLSEAVVEHADCYFNKSKEAVAIVGHNPRVLYQVFQKFDAVLAGMELVKPMFDNCRDTVVDSLVDGDSIHPWEPVMHIDAPIAEVVSLETAYLGIIARCTRVATNVRKCVDAANGKPLLFFPARFDVPDVQYYDGYAARIGGATGCSTHKQMSGYNDNLTPPVGTMPHALIAAFGGDTVKAALAFAKARPNEQVWVLVDFHNDCAKTSVEVFHALQAAGIKLAGVRLDTSEKNVDYGIQHLLGSQELRGVNPALVHHVRQALNEAGAHQTQICVSGGFNAEKIAQFERESVPVDVYAVGESTIKGANPFTSDIVRIMTDDGWKDVAKVGRSYSPSTRLVRWNR